MVSHSYVSFADKLLSEEKDSAKPLSLIASIYHQILQYFGIESELLTSRHKV